MRRLFLMQAVAILLAVPSVSKAVDLYTENFDVDHTANWSVFSGPTDFTDTDFSDGDQSSNQANFFFDYSTVGIPSAPNSAGGSTRGLKIMANQDGDLDGITPPLTGISVSPTGQSFTGDYKVTFDWWTNFAGPAPTGSTGTTQLSTMGVMSTNTVANYAGSADGVFFASTLDGGSSADFRIYSPERAISYQIPALNGGPADQDDLGQPIDGHANHLAASRNNTAALYQTALPAGTPPAAQEALYPQQTGTAQAGSPSFAWRTVEITKVGKIITWKVNGTELIKLDTTNYKSTAPPLGGNILFGHADINAGASGDPLRFDLIFSLFDNIQVSSITAGVAGDYNNNGVVDAADYVVWRNAAPGDTLPNDSTPGVSAADYDVFRANFGNTPSGVGAGVAVPEPSAIALFALAILASCGGRSRVR